MASFESPAGRAKKEPLIKQQEDIAVKSNEKQRDKIILGQLNSIKIEAEEASNFEKQNVRTFEASCK